MLTNDLVVVSNQGTVTLPGNQATKTFNQVAGSNGNAVLRRIAATANTTPEEILISHQVTGSGYATVCRSLIKASIRKTNVDTTTTGGIVPACSVGLTITRPLNMGANIVDDNIEDLLGQVFDVITRSGQLAKILNQEV
jgi:hypothetical protein